MAHELITQQENMTTPDLMEQPPKRDGTPLNGPPEGHQALFPSSESDSFRNRWNDIQVSFVDEPRPSVEKADQLVATVVQRLTQIYAEERSKLENEWAKGSEVSTEDLRQALRRYRTFFDRLLSA